ncbi:MAG: preprotein translocase subunit YajC [Oscillibacter sp.]|nr:preprotein translocase subunit YajC [Oscillibacter sp.]
MGDSSFLIMLALMFVLLYFMMIRPEQKRKKKAQDMRDNLKKGDSITTIGGIIGKVVSVQSESFVMETSDDRVRMEFAKWAVSQVNGVGMDGKAVKKAEPAPEIPEESASEAPAEESVEEKND